MRKFFTILIIAFIFVSCSKNVKEEFKTVFEKYNDALASSDLRSTFQYVAEKNKDEYIKSYDALAKKVRIFECRVMKQTVDELKGEARLDVEIGYYVLSSQKVKSLRYVQQWALVLENKDKVWKLVNTLPEF
jgi:hypothetical protein